MSGKGSDRRPMLVEVGQFDNNWERVFGQKDQRVEIITKDQDVIVDYVRSGGMLREVAHDGMWKHSCTVDMRVVWIGKDETCNMCGAWEEEGQ
jgi:hypothetical protein